MRIALALSGGGFRATVFHLGVLARLAEEDQLENVTYLSTVSGGSLCTGLVYALNKFQWPNSKVYKEKVLPEARKVITTKDLKGAMITRVLTHILDITDTRADDLSELIREHWGINFSLKDLPEAPRWMINATCYETGKNWRFERFRMGDYAFGYTYDTDIPLSDAMAASAGFPGLIGALALETSGRKWFNYKTDVKDALVMDAESSKKKKIQSIQPAYSPVHLWDGGVYDNHGLEGLHDFVKGWKEDIDFLIVSDAAGRSKPQAYRAGPKALERIITGIMMDQIRSLRARAILERIINHGDRGAFLQMGNTCEFVLNEADRAAEIPEKSPGCLSKEEADRAATMETDIGKLDDKTFERVFRHGFEVADYTLYAYNHLDFKYFGYENTRWNKP
jgi:NTE family protein